MMNCWDDMEREEKTITKVSDNGDYYSIQTGVWGIGLDKKYGIEPVVGDSIVTWGRFGFPCRGIAINQTIAFYRTVEEQAEQNRIEIEAGKNKRREEYEAKRSEYELKVSTFPQVFQDRINAFREFKGDEWRYEFEPYELFCCEEALNIVNTLKTEEAINTFKAASHEEQKIMVPNLSQDHSGNTFGASVVFAKMYLTNPELLSKMHGALCPLVGCEDYGCFAARQNQKGK